MSSRAQIPFYIYLVLAPNILVFVIRQPRSNSSQLQVRSNIVNSEIDLDGVGIS